MGIPLEELMFEINISLGKEDCKFYLAYLGLFPGSNTYDLSILAYGIMQRKVGPYFRATTTRDLSSFTFYSPGGTSTSAHGKASFLNVSGNKNL